MGATTALPVETSQTLVDATLDDLLAQPYAINVHESQDNIQNYIACGDLGSDDDRPGHGPWWGVSDRPA